MRWFMASTDRKDGVQASFERSHTTRRGLKLSLPLAFLPALMLSAGILAADARVAPGTATRTLSEWGCYLPLVASEVSISVTPDEGVQAYAVQDTPPEGWSVANISHGGTWDAVNEMVKWGPFFDDDPRTLTYEATPPDQETECGTFAGTASFDGQDAAIGGENELCLCPSHTITATAGDGGSIDPEGQVAVDWDEDQAFTITPDDCYEIDDVRVDGQSVGPVATYTFYNVQENHTIYATFSFLVLEITATAGRGGTIDPEGQVGVDCGDDQAFTIAPDECNEIEDVLVDGLSVGPVAACTFYDVHEDHTIEAVFDYVCCTVQHGIVAANHKWKTVKFPEPFDSLPVVVAGPATSKDREPGVVRIQKVTKKSFQIRFQEWDYLDGKHKTEAIRWMASETGVWALARGGQLCAGRFKVSSTKPKKVNFPAAFGKTPVVLAQVQTTKGARAVTDRICRVQKSNFLAGIQEQEDGQKHPNELVGYIAVSNGLTEVCGETCAAGLTPKKVRHKDFKVATALGSCKIFVEEEQSKDGEVKHKKEQVGYVAFGGTPLLVADMQTCAETDTATVRYRKTLKSLSFCEDERGEGLAGAAVLARVQGQQLPPVVITGAEPAMQGCGHPTVVTLDARESVVEGMRVAAFDHW